MMIQPEMLGLTGGIPEVYAGNLHEDAFAKSRVKIGGKMNCDGNHDHAASTVSAIRDTVEKDRGRSLLR
jgi:hypothetical protein